MRDRPQYNNVHGQNVCLTPLSLPQLVATLQKDKCEIALKAQNRGSAQSRDLSADLTITSTMRKLRSLTVSAAHKDNSRRFENNVVVNVNGQTYSYVMDMDHGSDSNTGNVKLAWPKDEVGGLFS